MIEFQKNKWKYTTIGLAAVLAVGFSFPQAFAAASIDSVSTIVKDIQAKVNSSVFGLSAIKTAVDTKASQSSVNSANTKLDDIQTAIGSLSPERTPVAFTMSVAITDGNNANFATIGITPGKILVIEDVSGSLVMEPGQIPFVTLQGLLNGNAVYQPRMIPVFVGSEEGNDFWVFHEPTTAYFNSEDMRLNFSRINGNDGSATLTVSVVGYQIDDPQAS